MLAAVNSLELEAPVTAPVAGVLQRLAFTAARQANAGTCCSCCRRASKIRLGCGSRGR